MHVAVLSAAGAPIQEIQRRIGHESIQTTIDVYGGMIGDVSDGVLDGASDIMARRRSVPGLAKGTTVRGEAVRGPAELEPSKDRQPGVVARAKGGAPERR